MEHLFTNHPDGSEKERIIVHPDIGRINNVHDIMAELIVKYACKASHLDGGSIIAYTDRCDVVYEISSQYC